jgi:hypothetical protein
LGGEGRVYTLDFIIIIIIIIIIVVVVVVVVIYSSFAPHGA